MRDEHWGRYHQPSEPERALLLDDPDEDEVQPLLFDLVKADNVAAVEAFLPQFNKLPEAVKGEMKELVAFSGSLAMLQLLVKSSINPQKIEPKLVIASIRGKNMETLRCLLLRAWLSESVIRAILMSDSVEIYQICKNFILDEPKVASKIAVANTLTNASLLKVTAGHPNREKLLLELWERVNLRERLGRIYLGDALVNIAQTTCSVMLAKTLIEWGANVDHRRSSIYLTPLHHAARRRSAEAAELMKFLLFCGANPEARSFRASISEELGAKEISKWLSISWDDLVAKAKEERGKANIAQTEST
jgi:Ankyrin repeat